ncbi:MAG: dCMP deaminase family protein [Rhodospirillales bacterium]|nr:dCMP deaminase family protein [Rhodospirillales bacterium]
MANWDQRFMTLARHVGEWSKDRSRRVGCVIVSRDNALRAIGYNGFPRGLDDERDGRHQRPAKYLWTEHAERNAIYEAARSGISIAGCRMYLPWFPCVDCARAIVQAGLAELICIAPDFSDLQWGEAFRTSVELLEEAGVEIRFHEE